MGNSITIFECIARCPIYSIRLPYAFQVKEALLIPLGTTLYGSLTLSLLNIESKVASFLSKVGSIEDLRKLNSIYGKFLESISLSTRISKTSRITKFRTIWKVIRYDRIHEKLMPRYRRDYTKVCSYLLNSFIKQGMLMEVTDAMVKESTYANEVIISMISPDTITLNLEGMKIEIDVRNLVKGLTYLTRLGDSESYCSILKCYEIKEYEINLLNEGGIVDSVNTVTILGLPDNQVISLIGGAAVVTYFNNPLIGLYRLAPNYAIYALPLRAESHIVRGKSITVYVPAKYSLKCRINGIKVIKYKSPADDEDVVHIYLPSYITQLSPVKAVKRRKRRKRR